MCPELASSLENITLKCLNLISYIDYSEVISTIALLFSVLSFVIARRDMSYVARIKYEFQDKEGTMPNFKIRVVNQGHIGIYPALIELIEVQTGKFFSKDARICENRVIPGHKISVPMPTGEPIAPGKRSFYDLDFPKELIQSSTPIKSMKFYFRLTLENDRVFETDRFTIKSKHLESMQKMKKQD